jgi:hypothetical protein
MSRTNIENEPCQNPLQPCIIEFLVEKDAHDICLKRNPITMLKCVHYILDYS